jgi:hypothetical protein
MIQRVDPHHERVPIGQNTAGFDLDVLVEVDLHDAVENDGATVPDAAVLGGTIE